MEHHYIAKVYFLCNFVLDQLMWPKIQSVRKDFKALQGGCHGLWKIGEILSGHMSPPYTATPGNPNLYLDQSISYVSYPTDNPNATRLGLCNNLEKTLHLY